MKRHIYKSAKGLAMFLATCSLLLATSCSDFLEQDNRSGRDADVYLNTPEGVAGLEAVAISGMKGTALNTELEEWGADLYIPTRKTSDIPVNSWSLTAEDGTVESYYTGVYSLISHANDLFEYAESSGVDKKAVYQAEARFIRSYGYYKLMQHFGGVPYIDHRITDPGRNYPKTALPELYEKVIADLQAALGQGLPATDRNGLVSEQAVNALLAKVCLEAAWDIDKAKYATQAESYATAAIAGQQLTLPFADKWAYNHQHNEEVIFALQYVRDGYPGLEEDGGHNLMFQYAGYYGTGAKSEGVKYGNSMMCPSLKGIYLWDSGDERYEATFMTHVYNAPKGKTWADGSIPDFGYFAYYNDKVDKSTLPMASWYAPWWTTDDEVDAATTDKTVWENHAGDTDDATKLSKAPQIIRQGATVTKITFKPDGSVDKKTDLTYSEQNGGTENNQCVRKWDDPQAMCADGDKKTDYREVPVLHLSDLYLVRAEARYLAGGDWLADVNAVRGRAKAKTLASLTDYKPQYAEASVMPSITANGIGQVTLDAVDLILDERARELWAERSRWTDLRRTRKLTDYNKLYNVYCAHDVRTYHPIPASAIVGNEGMADSEQNPGY